MHLRRHHYGHLDHHRHHRTFDRVKPPPLGPHASTFCGDTYESDGDDDGGVASVAAQLAVAMAMTMLIAALVSAEGVAALMMAAVVVRGDALN